MNLLNLEVKIERLKLQIEPNTTLAFSLRLGRVLTSITHQIGDILPPGPFMDIREGLILTCEESHLKSVSRACLVINKVGHRHQKELLGMVFIPLGNAQRQVSYYRIQQSSSTDPYLELSFSISNLELHCEMNESSLSKSSLAEIKEFHKFLSIGGHGKSNSDFTLHTEDLRRNNMISKQNVENFNKINNCKTERSNTENENEDDISYKIINKRLEEELCRERERIKILTNLFLIEEEKNKELQTMLEVVFDEIKNRKNRKCEGSVEQITSVLICDEENEDSECGERIDYKVLLQERNEYYALCEELSTKVKLLGDEKKQLAKKLENVENQLSIRVGELSELKIQNTDLRAEMFDLYDQSCPIDIELKQENERLKGNVEELERRMKECMKVIEGYKDNVWKIQEELLLKENEVNVLREEMELTKSGCFGLRKSTRDSTDNSSEKHNDMTFENMKMFSGILLNNKEERMEIFERFKLMKEENACESYDIEERILNIINMIKDRFSKLFIEFSTKNVKFIQVLQMRSEVMKIMNLSVF